MNNILRMVLAGFLLFGGVEIIKADTLVLQDGTRVSGVLVGATAQTISFKDRRALCIAVRGPRYKVSSSKQRARRLLHQQFKARTWKPFPAEPRS